MIDRHIFARLAVAAVTWVLLALMFAAPAQAQQSAEQRCIAELTDASHGLQWDINNINAQVWMSGNASNLCAGTYSPEYNQVCFAEAIRRDLKWWDAIPVCVMRVDSCVYKHVTALGYSFGPNGELLDPSGRALDYAARRAVVKSQDVNADFRNAIGKCVFNEQVASRPSARPNQLTLSKCAESIAKNFTFLGLNFTQEEAARLCGNLEFSDQPGSCINSMNQANRPSMLGVDGGATFEAAKAQVATLCAQTFDSGITITCFEAGIHAGFDAAAAINVCGFKPDNEDSALNALRTQGGSASSQARQVGTVYGMGYNCVTARVIDQRTGGLVSAEPFPAAWNACVGQPLF